MGECGAISFIDDVVFKSIDDTLAAVLGFGVRDILYLALLTKYSVTREDVAKHLDAFQRMLENEFGQRGAKVLSKAIAKRIYTELKLKFLEDQTFGLPEYVAEARLRLLETNSRMVGKLDTEIRAYGKNKSIGNDDSP